MKSTLRGLGPFHHLVLCLLVLLLCACIPPANAQSIQLSADVTQADGQASPTLTWSTTPAATSCTASGDWSGMKAPAGSESLGPFTSSATFNLACTWPGDTTAELSWVNPTQNTDGSAYTDPQSVRLVWVDAIVDDIETFDCADPDANPFIMYRDVLPSVAAETITDLGPTGTVEFAAYAINQRDVCSGQSNIVSKLFSGSVNQTESVGLVVNPVPAPITLLEAS